MDDLSFSKPKTKDMVNVLANLNVGKKALVVTASTDGFVQESARNIPGVKPVVAESINVYDVLNHDKLIITKEAIAMVEEVLA